MFLDVTIMILCTNKTKLWYWINTIAIHLVKIHNLVTEVRICFCTRNLSFKSKQLTAKVGMEAQMAVNVGYACILVLKKKYVEYFHFVTEGISSKIASKCQKNS